MSPSSRAALVAALLALSGSDTRAQVPVPTSHGTLEVRVTDHREAIGDFGRLELLVEALEIHPAGEPRQRGWIDLRPTTARVDLTQVTEGRHAVLFIGPAPVRRYDAIRLRARLGEVAHREGRPVSVRAEFSPIALPRRTTEELRVFILWQHILFHLGRATGYALLGGLAGMLGAAVAFKFDIEGQVGLAAGLFVMAVGLHFVGRGPGVGRIGRLVSGLARLPAFLWRGYRRVATSAGILGLGFVQALLPCPLLYVLVVSAASMRDAYDGFQLAVSFAVGTTPALWGVAAVAHRVTARRRAVALRAAGAVVMAWGLLLLAHSLEALRLIPRALVPDIPLDWIRAIAGF